MMVLGVSKVQGSFFTKALMCLIVVFRRMTGGSLKVENLAGIV